MTKANAKRVSLVQAREILIGFILQHFLQRLMRNNYRRRGNLSSEPRRFYQHLSRNTRPPVAQLATLTLKRPAISPHCYFFIIYFNNTTLRWKSGFLLNGGKIWWHCVKSCWIKQYFDCAIDACSLFAENEHKAQWKRNKKAIYSQLLLSSREMKIGLSRWENRSIVLR